MFTLMQKSQLMSPEHTRAEGKVLHFVSRLESRDRMCLFRMTSINLAAHPYLKLTSGYRRACNILMANGKVCSWKTLCELCRRATHARGTRHPVLEKVQDLIIFMHSFIHTGGNTFASSLLDLWRLIFRKKKKEKEPKKKKKNLRAEGINLISEWEPIPQADVNVRWQWVMGCMFHKFWFFYWCISLKCRYARWSLPGRVKDVEGRDWSDATGGRRTLWFASFVILFIYLYTFITLVLLCNYGSNLFSRWRDAFLPGKTHRDKKGSFTTTS